MQILKIRYYQLKRDLGFLSLIILGLISGFSYFIYNHSNQYGIYYTAIVFYLFYNFHKNRLDLTFVRKHFKNAQWQVVVEYQLFSLAFSVPCLFTNYWYCFFLLHALTLVIVFTNLKTKYSFKYNWITHFFKNEYIFISGIRRNLFPLIIFFVLAIVLSPLKLFPLVALFLFNSIVFSFYEANESVQMLQASLQSPKQFMASLLISGVKKLICVNMPVLVINSIFNMDMWMFNMYFFVYNILILATVIALKYEGYRYKSISNNFQIKLIIMVFGLFIPYLLPLAIIFYFQSQTGALKNLNQYLDVVN